MSPTPPQIEIVSKVDASKDPLRRAVARPSVAIESVDTGAGTAIEFKWVGEQHFLALHDIKTVDGETRLGDLRAEGGADMVGTMTFVPAGHEVSGWSQNVARRNGFAAVYLDPDTAAHELADVSSSIELRPKLYFRNQGLMQTVQKLQRCLTHPENSDPLYMDALSIVLSVELFRIAAADAAGNKPASKLSNRQLKQVMEAIESNLDSPLALQSLADIAGLSRFHFLRAFKASAGLSPHQFVLSKRISRARDLLERSQLPISEISRLAGFGSAAHFAKVFHASVGMTPSEYRSSR